MSVNDNLQDNSCPDDPIMASTKVHHREEDSNELRSGSREDIDPSYPQVLEDFREIRGHKYCSDHLICPNYIAYTPGVKTQATYFNEHGEE